MGLLDSMNDPMMGLAMGLLSAGGPSARPVSLGQAMGQGYQGFQDAQKQQQELMRQQAQAKIQQMQMAQAQQKQQFIQNMPDMSSPGFIKSAVQAGAMDIGTALPMMTKDNKHTWQDVGDHYEQQDANGNLTGVKLPKGVAPQIHWTDNGESIMPQIFQDGKIQTLGETKKIASPEAVMSNRVAMGNLAERHAENNSAPAGASITPDTLKLMAQQYRAGDTTIFTNLGRGAQGAANIVALRNEIARQTTEAGGDGTTIAARNAEYAGTKAGQRAAGTRIANIEMAANEAQMLIPLAKQASDQVARNFFLPFGKAQIMFNEQTNDPNLRKFAAANNSLVNVYSRAISPSGVPTVSDKEHAREMLSTAYDQKSYNAVLDQMNKEIEAARQAPKAVRQAFNEAVTGRSQDSGAVGATMAGPKTATLADIAATAAKSGRSTAEVTAALRKNGYTIQGAQ